MNQPAVFISCVSPEFRQTRSRVGAILTRLGYTPVIQEILGTEPGDLRQVLRDKIDACEGLIHIVGQGYGAEPPAVDAGYGRVSYTQFEFLYAVTAQTKKTWLLFAGDACTRDTPLDRLDLPFPNDPAHPDPAGYQAERRALQLAYRDKIRNSSPIYYDVTSDADLDLKVERLRDELAELRQAEEAFRRELFDVFLCYNSDDKPAVREISQQLVKKGIKPWLGEEQIRPGTSWQTALGQQIEDIKSAAVFVGESGLGPWQDQDIQALLSQFVKRECPIIPVVLPSAKTTPDLPWALLAGVHWVDFRVTHPDPLQQLIWGITGRSEAQPLDIPTLLKARRTLASLAADSDEGEDRLDIKSEVEAFSAVLASKDLRPPLCLGIFGDWGMGKTFIMKKMLSHIQRLCERSEEAQEDKTAFCRRIAQITFNAWHYADANLWASLACRIFEGLDEFISCHSDNPEAKKAQLFKELNTAREKLEAAKKASEVATEEVKAAKAELEGLERERREKTLRLEDVRKGAIKLVLAKDSELCQRLQEAAKQIGLERLAGNVEQLEEVLKEFRSASGRVKAMFLALVYGKDRWWRFSLLLVILILIPLVGIGIEKLLSFLHATGAMAQITPLIAQVGTVFVATTAWLMKNLKWATSVVDKVDQAREEADEALRNARAQSRPAETRLQKELLLLKEREASARTTLKDAEEKVQETEKEKQQLEQRANGKVLAEFIRDKVRGATYQGQLGIISFIRKDLQALSDLLAEVKKHREIKSDAKAPDGKPDSHLPRIDRIVLYIDDLDRCPEMTVVEVLQAVHLLLAFPLFIVVIGVDSRWLLRSLRHHYAALRGLEEGANQEVFEGTPQFISTPQNYLEKIIQVPFNLRRMDGGSFQRLMESILPFQQDEAPKMEAERAEKALPVSEASASETNADSEIHRAQQERFGQEQETQKSTAVEEYDLLPEALIVRRKEIEFMAELVSLIPTPRAAKRLGNIYRLIRAGVSPAALPQFLGRDQQGGEYQTVLALLAIQVGFPLVANELFARMRRDSPESWADIRGIFDTNDSATESREGPKANGSSESVRVQQREHLRLASCLDELLAKKKLPYSLDNCISWIDRISRYSFRATEQDYNA